MNVYLLFAGAYYYPNGGWDDYEGYFLNLQEAIDHAKKVHSNSYDWWHVVHDGKIVASSYERDY